MTLCGSLDRSYSAEDYEKWRFIKLSNGHYCIKNNKNRNLVLELNGKKCKKRKGSGCGSTRVVYSKKCSSTRQFDLVKNGNHYGIRSVKYPNLFVRADFRKRKYNTQYYSNNKKPGGYELFAIEFEDYYKKMGGIIAARYTPIIYTHDDEEFFPVRLEWLNIDWTNVPLEDTSYQLKYNFSAGTSLNNNAYAYTNLHQTSTQYIVTYAIIYAYNECGPAASFSATVEIPGEEIGLKDERVTLCPGGVHNGDIEHVEVYLNRAFEFENVVYAYHSFSTSYNKDEVEWQGTHPIAYMALGSHALYNKPGVNKYLKLWDESSIKKTKCPVPCMKEQKVPYPCGIKSCGPWYARYPCPKICHVTEKVPWVCEVDCNWGAATDGYFVDFCRNNKNSKYKFSPKPRIIKSNFYTLDNNLTIDEKNMNVFIGRFGYKIENEGFESFKKTILSLTSIVRKYCSSCNKKIKEVLDELDGKYQSSAPASLAKKSWWL